MLEVEPRNVVVLVLGENEKRLKVVLPGVTGLPPVSTALLMK